MFNFSRNLVVYITAAFLAFMLGCLIVTPGAITFSIIAVLLIFLALPLLFKWHYFLLLIFWNASLVAFFLPGHPDLWIVFAGLSFSLSILNHIMFRKRFLPAPELTFPLIVFTVIIVETAIYRGGLNIYSMGGTTAGGRYYIYVLMAIVGYFAFTARRTPIVKSKNFATCYFGAGLCGASNNLAIIAGITAPYIYFFLPNQFAVAEVMHQIKDPTIMRFIGFAPAASSGLCVLLCRYGLQGLLDFSKPWRPALALSLVALSLLGGFRSIVAFTGLLIFFQFHNERLLATRFFAIGIGLVICVLIFLIFFSRSMPNSVQRAISFLPLNVEPEVRSDARASTEWRLNMWSELLKDVPKYLFIGKGYGMDPVQMTAINDAAALGVATTATSYDTFILASDYHSGPLSVLIPFGLCGFLTFIWILISCYRVLSLNYRCGDLRLRVINSFLISYFMSNCVCFFFVFGALNSQLAIFLGVCGLSISLNGGVRRRQILPRPRFKAPEKLTLASAS